MAGETIAVSQGSQALAGHNPVAANETKRIFADEQGALRVDANVKNMSFTWNGDNTVNTIDVVRVVNGVDVTKRVTFTWAASKLQSLVSSIV
jgi:hypothetical protein